MKFGQTKSSSTVSKILYWCVILCTMHAVITAVDETFDDGDVMIIPSNSTLNDATPNKIPTISRQFPAPVPDPSLPNFKGQSRLHSLCDYILYSILYLPIQKSVIGKQRTKLELSPQYFFVYEEAKKRLEFTEFHVQDVICNTEGFDVGFQTPMQCSNVSKLCECLVINDLSTVQPLGVVGCLADLGSFCIPGAIECAFGYVCIEGQCGATIHLIPSENIIAATITLCAIIFHYFT